MRKKGQVNVISLLTLIAVIIFLLIAIPIISSFFQSIKSGDIEIVTGQIANVLPALVIIAIFFEFLRRLFG